MSDVAFMLLHDRYMAGEPIGKLATEVWHAAGYSTQKSCDQAIRKAFKQMGLPLRSSADTPPGPEPLLETGECTCYDGKFSDITPNVKVSIRCPQHTTVPARTGHSLMFRDKNGKVHAISPAFGRMGMVWA